MSWNRGICEGKTVLQLQSHELMTSIFNYQYIGWHENHDPIQFFFFSFSPSSGWGALAQCGGSRCPWQRDLLCLVCSCSQISSDTWKSGGEMLRSHCCCQRICKEPGGKLGAKGFSSWRKRILTSNVFVMAHESGISLEPTGKEKAKGWDFNYKQIY